MAVLEWIVRVISAVFSLFIANPLLAGIVAVVLGLLPLIVLTFLPAREQRPPLWHPLVLAGLWAGYAVHEASLLGKGYDIRVDMLLICPALLLTTVGLLERWIRAIRAVQSQTETIEDSPSGDSTSSLGAEGSAVHNKQSD